MSSSSSAEQIGKSIDSFELSKIEMKDSSINSMRESAKSFAVDQPKPSGGRRFSITLAGLLSGSKITRNIAEEKSTPSSSKSSEAGTPETSLPSYSITNAINSRQSSGLPLMLNSKSSQNSTEQTSDQSSQNISTEQTQRRLSGLFLFSGIRHSEKTPHIITESNSIKQNPRPPRKSPPLISVLEKESYYPYDFDSFFSFCGKEKVTEMVEFYLAVKQFKDNVRNLPIVRHKGLINLKKYAKEEAKHIIELFINVNSEKELNISQILREEFNKKYESGITEMFDSIINHVVDILRMDVYHRFLKYIADKEGTSSPLSPVSPNNR
jgi:hypothetical protein